MHDSGPYGLNGAIGADIAAGASYDGATGYRWAYASPTAPPAKPGRIASVVTSPYLDPGDGDYTVEFRYRTTRNFGNVLQKGQNATAGGYFKFEQPNGFMTCMFKDRNGGQKAVISPIATNDGAWHVIRCELSSWGVRLYVDGVQVVSGRRTLANISNSWPLTIGGKGDCDQIVVTCDYFTGDIDYVRIEKSGTTTPPPPGSSDCTVQRSGTTATLTWTPSGGNDIVRRNGAWLATPPKNTSTYTDTNSTPGASYLIRMSIGGTAVDVQCVESSPPPPPPPPPPPGSGCVATPAGGTIVLTWADTGGSYVIRRNGSWLANAGTGVARYVDTSPPAGATYVVREWKGAVSVDIPCG